MSSSRWIQSKNAIGFISKREKYDGGTFAHPDIALEFASWIDTGFKLYLIKEFERLKKEEEILPEKKKTTQSGTLEEVPVVKILTFTLEELEKMKLLDVYFDYTVDLERRNLYKFHSVLGTYRIVVQMIFYNLDSLSLEEQMLFNELYWFNRPYFNTNAFIKGKYF